MEQLKFFIVIILILIIFSILYKATKKLQIKSNVINKRFGIIKLSNNNDLYNNIVGDNVDDVVRTLTERLTKKVNKNIDDYVKLGDIWHNVCYNDNIAYEYYKKAYDKMKEEIKSSNDEILYNSQIDKIKRFKENENPISIREINVNEIFEDELSELELLNYLHTLEKIDDSNKISKTKTYYDIAKRVNSDPQNVHDTEINKQIRAQYTFIKEKVESAQYIDHPDLIEFIYKRIKNEPTKYNKKNIDLYLINIKRNDKFMITKEGEFDMITTIWKYIHLNEQTSKTELEDAFMDAINNSYEINTYTEGPVCINGRIANIIGSLSLLDVYGKGVLKSINIYRNECFNKAHKIKDEILKQQDAALLKAYNDDLETDEVKSLIAKIKSEIELDLTKSYHLLLDDKTLTNIVNEALIGV